MGLNWQWRWYVDEDGEETPDPQCCEMCDADVPVYNFGYRVLSEKRGESRYLCELCASTPAGNAHEYFQQYDHGDRCIMQTVNYAANAVLLQLGRWGDRSIPKEKSK